MVFLFCFHIKKIVESSEIEEKATNEAKKIRMAGKSVYA